MCYYAVNNHQYLIKDTKKKKSLVEKAKDQKSITFDKSILEKKEIENIYLYEMLENIPVTDLKNYKNEIHNKIVVMYSREGFSDISDLLYECIQHYNIIPDDIKASKTKIKSFHILLDGHT